MIQVIDHRSNRGARERQKITIMFAPTGKAIPAHHAARDGGV